MNLIDIGYIVVYAIMLYVSLVWFTVYFKNRGIFLKNPRPKKFPSITFLLPAYNAEKTIKRCIESIFNLNYPKEKIKVIVIDDGSKDKTVEIVKQYKDRVKLIRQKHKGKASALNNALKYVDTELVACMDVDSYPDKNYLLNSVGYFENKNVAAVTPSLKVENTDSLIRKIQWVEYIFSIFLRKVFSITQTQYVIPGPGGIYRASVLKEVGGFDEKNITEDMEMGFRLINRGYRLENSVNAFVFTECPKDFREFYKQRIRWYVGYWLNVKKYSHMIFNIKYGNLGIFLLPVNFLWLFVLAFLLITQIFFGVKSLIEFFINWGYINYAFTLPKFNISLLLLDSFTFFNILFLGITLLSIWISIHVSEEKIDLRRRIKFYLAFIFIYPFLFSILWILSIIYELLGVKIKW
jgi:poly-beta-1,6-N-acetyl-D-glucosamine synthase